MKENNRTNCPNCGAPIDQHADKCAYCDTPYIGQEKTSQHNITEMPDIFKAPTIIFRDRHKANELLEHMQDIIDMYGCCTVADLRDLIGEPSSYSCNNYGWTTLSEVTYHDDIRELKYSIRFPRPIPLK